MTSVNHISLEERLWDVVVLDAVRARGYGLQKRKREHLTGKRIHPNPRSLQDEIDENKAVLDAIRLQLGAQRGTHH